MKLTTGHILLIFILALAGCRQEPKQYADYSESSGFTVTNIDSVSVENLTVLAKVWGFAKYHHPAFAHKHLNADYELFELLPRVAMVNRDDRNTILLEWVQGLGEFKSIEEKLREQIAEKGYTTPSDTDWLSDEELLGAELSQKLQDLQFARRPKPSRYARYYKESAGQANFSDESEYYPSQSDDGYNLLTLFRLWNMAEYYFPNVNITDKKWSDVLPEYIPKFLQAAERIELTTAELITELGDTHSQMAYNPVFFYGDRSLPAELGFVEGKLIVTDNRKLMAHGEEPILELGDEIILIGDRKPEYFIDLSRRYMAASNESVVLRNAADLAHNVTGENVSVIAIRDGRQRRLDVPTIAKEEIRSRNNKWLENKTYYDLLNDSVGYIYPEKWRHESGDGAVIMEKFKGTKAIIVDFRCYPTGMLPYDFIGPYLVPEEISYVTLSTPVVGLPGYYELSRESMGKTNPDYYKGKIIVLVNEHTQSSAEYQTMAFQACPNAVVIGSQTAGADGNIVPIPLPGENITRASMYNFKTMFSGLGVYYPDGTNTQRTGIRIDHYVTPTIEGVKAGRDELLEKALELIEEHN